MTDKRIEAAADAVDTEKQESPFLKGIQKADPMKFYNMVADLALKTDVLEAEKQELIMALRKIENEASQFPKDVFGYETISGLCTRIAREILTKHGKRK